MNLKRFRLEDTIQQTQIMLFLSLWLHLSLKYEDKIQFKLHLNRVLLALSVRMTWQAVKLKGKQSFGYISTGFDYEI